MPSRGDFSYTFDALTDVLDGFTDAVGFDRYAIYVFDYGARIGFRLAVRHPEGITAIITQNGNAYEEGLSDGWNPIQAYWSEPCLPPALGMTADHGLTSGDAESVEGECFPHRESGQTLPAGVK